MSDLPEFIEDERDMAAVAPGAIKYWTERSLKAERERDKALAQRDAVKAVLRDEIAAAEKSAAIESEASQGGSFYAMGATFAFNLTARRLREPLAELEES